MNRRAKIIVTLGPASDDKKTIKKLLQAGMDVARINFSHGNHGEHARVIDLLRETSRELNRPVTIMQDLSGPKIRTGEFDPIPLKEGSKLILTTEKDPHSDQAVYVNYPDLPTSVEVNSRILLDDGKLELVVRSIKGKNVTTEVIQGGLLKSHKGVNLPGAKLSLSALTEKDISDLQFGLSREIDILALSFVRSAADINRLREEIKKINPGKKEPSGDCQAGTS